MHISAKTDFSHKRWYNIGVSLFKYFVMKKVLILLDGAHFSSSALEFANQLNETERILLTGLFLPSIDYKEMLMYYAGGWAWPLYVPTIDTDADTIEKNITLFKEYCIKAGIEFRVHKEIDGRVKDVIGKESRYADMMLMSGESFYGNLGEVSQQEYIEDALLKAECPVIILPEKTAAIDNLIIAYDGSSDSVFAFKQFTYLFPELCKLPAMVVYASDKGDTMPDLAYMEELCTRHFTDLTFFQLEADAQRYFNTWIVNNGNALVIAGSYASRGLFRKHFTEELIKEHQLPLFIAHT